MDKKTRVLLIEDSEVGQLAAKSILEQLNCEVETASNGAAALQSVHANIYDIIFVDLGLPDKDGIEVAAEIRKSSNGNSRAPIVALTIRNDNEQKDRCKAVGIDDFMDKPLSIQFAREIIEDLVLHPRG
jgi:CheY-like chemotaxis protein